VRGRSAGSASVNRAQPECPLTEFRTFPCNTRWYAEHWLRRGDAHPQEHWVIRERLDPWRRRVAEVGLREALLAEILPEPLPMCAAPRPSPTMPLPASAEPAGELKPLPRRPSTPPQTTHSKICAQATKETRKSVASLKRAKRAYHRRVKPRGTGRWAQKRRRNVA
jgi:hypothetical protein